MKKLIMGIMLTLIALNCYAIKINGVVKTLHYMNPNDTVMVSDEKGVSNTLRVLYNETLCFVDSNSSNSFAIIKSGKYVLQGYSGSGGITLTSFEIKAKLLPAPTIIGLFSFCNNTEDTFFMQIAKPSDYGRFMVGSFTWYFGNGIQGSSWPVEWQFATSLVGKYKYTCLDNNGNLFKSLSTYVTCGNKIKDMGMDEAIDMYSKGKLFYDITGREAIPYLNGMFVVDRGYVVLK